MGLTIRNTAGAINGQAVAVRNTADLSSFYHCSIEGYQDTLYTHSMRQFYRECNIYGTVDFIMGNAAVVFQKCNIYARVPLPGQGNTITAQSRSDPYQNTGFSLQGCQFKAAPDLAAIGNSVPTFLGRPWRPYSRVVVMQSFLDSLINPAGWSAWSGTSSLSTVYYAEFANWGPGAWAYKRVTWPGFHLIGSNDASKFMVSAFIVGDSWLWRTGVPYNSGFL
jgi:pectinesterase